MFLCNFITINFLTYFNILLPTVYEGANTYISMSANAYISTDEFRQHNMEWLKINSLEINSSKLC